MSYQQYMNMGGFGPPGSVNPYMMGFQGPMGGMQMPMQMPINQAQYATNHNRPPVAPPMNVQPQHHQQQQHQQHQQQQQLPMPSKGAVGGKRKMNSDPNRPKRPTSAYFFFVQIEREDAARRGEKITRVAEWTKQVSAKWRELTVEQKEQYQNMAASDKSRYTSQMAAYTGKDANRPKRPQSAYFLWLADFRARMKNKFSENKDILRAAGEEWRRLTTVEKSPYEQRAEEERRKYEQLMKDYNITGGSAAAKKQRVEDAQRDAKTAAAAVSTSLSNFHSQHGSGAAQQQQQAPLQLKPEAAPPTPQQLLPAHVQQLPLHMLSSPQQQQQPSPQQQQQMQELLQQQMLQQQRPQQQQHHSKGGDDSDDDDDDEDGDDYTDDDEEDE